MISTKRAKYNKFEDQTKSYNVTEFYSVTQRKKERVRAIYQERESDKVRKRERESD